MFNYFFKYFLKLGESQLKQLKTVFQNLLDSTKKSSVPYNILNMIIAHKNNEKRGFMLNV